MSFHNIRFPENISIIATAQIARPVHVTKLANGMEWRNVKYDMTRRKYAIGSAVQSADELYQLAEFFEAREGASHSFRFRDFSDDRSGAPSKEVNAKDALIGFGDGRTRRFQLGKTYLSGEQKKWRKITKPVLNSIRINIAERPQFQNIDYVANPITGEIEFSKAPETGAPIEAGFQFDVPVRFDLDQLEVNFTHFNCGEVPNIELIEVFE